MHNGNVESLRVFSKEDDARRVALNLVREQRDVIDFGSTMEDLTDKELLEDWPKFSGGDDIQVFPVDVE